MPRYTYQAYDRDGALNAGEIDAPSRQSALDALHRQGKLALDVTERADGAQPLPWWQRDLTGGGAIKLADLALFTRELATLIKADLLLDDVLRIVSLQPLISARMRTLAARLHDAVREGQSLATALAADGGFPVYYCRLVQAGEASGSLGPVLDDLTAGLDRTLELRRQITSALIYPATLLVAAVCALVVIVAVLLPTIVPLFTDAGAPLPGSVQVMMAARDFVAGHWLAMVIAVVLGLAVSMIAMRDPRLRLARDRMLLRLPVAGKLIADRETARFGRTMSTLLHHGVPLLDAVEIVAGVHRNAAYGVAAAETGSRLKEGGSLSTEMVASGLFSDLATRLAAVGEQTGQLDTMLMQAATIYEATVQRQLTRLMSLITPLLTLLIGALVGGLILSVMNAILSVNELAFG